MTQFRGHSIIDIPVFVDQLMRAVGGGAFLIIGVGDSDDFIQLSGDATGVQLDFPMVTARQQSKELIIRSVAKAEGLVLVENYGSDGTRFLDFDIEPPAQRIADVCATMLRQVFDVSDRSELFFELEGLD